MEVFLWGAFDTATWHTTAVCSPFVSFEDVLFFIRTFDMNPLDLRGRVFRVGARARLRVHGLLFCKFGFRGESMITARGPPCFCGSFRVEFSSFLLYSSWVWYQGNRLPEKTESAAYALVFPE